MYTTEQLERWVHPLKKVTVKLKGSKYLLEQFIAGCFPDGGVILNQSKTDCLKKSDLEHSLSLIEKAIECCEVQGIENLEGYLWERCTY
jgi:hypothetical protein